MLQSYLTIRGSGAGEYTEKRSRFIGEVHHVESEAEAAALLQAARKKYYDARHHCSAWILGDDGSSRKASDDGEPQGTAGVPMLKVLDGAGCTNIAVIVTRYFGGTLLGTGGLVRAYTQAAKEALADAELVRMCLCTVYEVTVEYSQLDRLLYFLRQKDLEPAGQTYTDKVSMEITVPQENAQALAQEITALTGGQALIGQKDQGFFPVPVI